VLHAVWGACVAQALVCGLVCVWVRSSRRMAWAFPAGFLSVALAVAAFVEMGIAVWIFWGNWQPFCEGALKKVWAGRLTDAAEARMLARRLSRRGLLILGLCATPAAYAVILAWLGMTHSALLAILVGASLAGLGFFRWYGLQPALGVFQQAERILQGG